jgi:hypothetical protein
VEEGPVTDEPVLTEAKNSLARVQDFDAAKLSRRAELGAARNFDEAVDPARTVIALYQRINADRLDIYSTSQLNQIRDTANSTYNIFDQIITFDGANAPNETRMSLIEQVKAQTRNLPDQLASLISYSVACTLDPTATQQQMRALTQGFSDERDKALREVGDIKSEVEEVLKRVRDAAAEQGVSTQSTHFKVIADAHDEKAKVWLKRAVLTGIGTLGFALVATFSYRIPWVAPKSNIEAAQLITSKLVILGILGYALITCVRSYLSQTHNAVVNRHRQNALLTYTAFVDAAPSSASRDIVLTHAAASVFSPQDTGFVRNEEPAGGRSVLEMISKGGTGLGDAKASGG